ncbi:polysaccharide pyruvyl transferase family protein [Methylobacterium flocculans]|uniref:polysaccharide pyruvyl transferase family protein n=1 Tax=Methylobacterium flocculans TaxID=2984843 RepID=UPI0021F39BE8|nr:polysaccharide pyruvyl transferase family protein [Methylobacterium sp. FF17]
MRQSIDKELSSLIPTSNKFSLLDFPDHDNIGDSAIYLGETAYFARSALRPSFTSTCHVVDWKEITERVADGPIFLHGGGNFGDLWPAFQEFRENVLLRFQDRQVIQLPQTIHFRNTKNIERTARAIERHPAFTLFVRDNSSLELATRNFECDVRLCPDMAFFLNIKKEGNPKHELLLHLRNDKESAQMHDSSKYANCMMVVRADWPSEKRNFAFNSKLETVLQSLTNLEITNKPLMREKYYRLLAGRRLKRGLSLLSSARLVITDRLHGHILCVLLGIPHCVIDNSYGKLGSFMNTWGTMGDQVYTATSLDDAVNVLTRAEGLKLKD